MQPRDSSFMTPKILVKFQWVTPTGPQNKIGYEKMAISDKYIWLNLRNNIGLVTVKG